MRYEATAALGALVLVAMRAGVATSADAERGAGIVPVADKKRPPDARLKPPLPPKRGSWDNKDCWQEDTVKDSDAVHRLCCEFTYSAPAQTVSSCGPWHKW
ncbi:MAG: hypothetical protein AB1749_04860 [Pseudomonadota bacterium]